MYDVVIIGAGVSGCAIARELSRKKGNVLVVEQEEDVCCGTSKANSAIVHAGYDAENGSLMAKLNVEGNQMMPELAKELYQYIIEECKKQVDVVETGEFGADMKVMLENDGPFTVILEL